MSDGLKPGERSPRVNSSFGEDSLLIDDVLETNDAKRLAGALRFLGELINDLYREVVKLKDELAKLRDEGQG